MGHDLPGAVEALDELSHSTCRTFGGPRPGEHDPDVGTNLRVATQTL